MGAVVVSREVGGCSGEVGECSGGQGGVGECSGCQLKNQWTC